jgi:hypothetical protein
VQESTVDFFNIRENPLAGNAAPEFCIVFYFNELEDPSMGS